MLGKLMEPHEDKADGEIQWDRQAALRHVKDHELEEPRVRATV